MRHPKGHAAHRNLLAIKGAQAFGDRVALVGQRLDTVAILAFGLGNGLDLGFRAAAFNVSAMASWQDPALDYTLERPVGALAKKQWQDTRAAERDLVMARLSERYGLFYFFAQTCGACEVMSPIVKAVASRWRITVRAAPIM